MLSTENMGGIVVTPSQLSEMQAGDYILHARDSVLNKVPVEKTRMSLDPQRRCQQMGKRHRKLTLLRPPVATDLEIIPISGTCGEVCFRWNIP